MDYWIIIDDTEQGPFTIEQLAAMELEAHTPVWHEGLEDWLPAANVEQLANIVRAPELPPIPVEAPPVPATEIEHTPWQQQQPEYKAVPQSMATPANTTQPVIYVPVDAIPPGYVAVMPAEPKSPPTYLAWAIVCTIICFLPLGICAIICSIKTKSSFKSGNMEKASRLSERTALFIILSFVAWLIWMPFSVVLAMI